MEFLGKERLSKIFTSEFKEFKSVEYNYNTFVLDKHKGLYQESISFIKDDFVYTFSRECTFFGIIYRFSRRQVNIIADFHNSPGYEVQNFILSGDNLLPCTYTGDVLEIQEEQFIDVEQERQCKVCVCKLCEKRPVCKPCLPFCDHKTVCDSCFGCKFFKQVKKGIWKCNRRKSCIKKKF